MKPILLTGDRPTGKLHLGHFIGSLRNRVALQEKYTCYFILADLHTLTTRSGKDKIKQLPQNIANILLDYLAVGIDPQKAVIYRQSLVPETAYLYLLLAMMVQVGRLERVPTLKDVMRDLKISQPSLGLLSYPVLQAADILLFKANLVPVGKDQAAHLEVAREIARKFNKDYGQVFPVPKPLIGGEQTLIGLDGKAKMSKSLGNCIYLSDNEQEVEQKVMSMYTDPKRIHATDPGRVKGNPVFIYHDVFNVDKKQVADLKQRYAKGRVGDVEVKQKLAKALNDFLAPMRARRQKYENNGKLLERIISQGSQQAQQTAQATLAQVKTAMGLN